MMESEFLQTEELLEITGYKHPSSQKDWLDKNGWRYVVNGSGRPIVNRWYARMRMSGITPTMTGMDPAWKPNFASLG